MTDRIQKPSWSPEASQLCARGRDRYVKRTFETLPAKQILGQDMMPDNFAVIFKAPAGGVVSDEETLAYLAYLFWCRAGSNWAPFFRLSCRPAVLDLRTPAQAFVKAFKDAKPVAMPIAQALAFSNNLQAR